MYNKNTASSEKNMLDEIEGVIQGHRDGHGFEEIGRRLKHSSDAARMLWYRAFKQLSVELERTRMGVGGG